MTDLQMLGYSFCEFVLVSTYQRLSAALPFQESIKACLFSQQQLRWMVEQAEETELREHVIL